MYYIMAVSACRFIFQIIPSFNSPVLVLRTYGRFTHTRAPQVINAFGFVIRSKSVVTVHLENECLRKRQYCVCYYV